MNIEEFKELFLEKAKLINVPPDLYPGFGEQTGEAVPFVEVSEGYFPIYRYIVKERGREYENKMTQDLDEVLYWVFKQITAELAFSRSERVRRNDIDSRRVYFGIQQELMGKLSVKWKDQFIEYINRVLAKSPYDDYGNIRWEYEKELVRGGMSNAEANRKAEELYPSPKGSSGPLL